MGHFVLRDTDSPKVFIGTGTGFAPLYFMLKSLLSKSTKHKAQSKKKEVFFLFGVRDSSDVFYQDQLSDWAEMYPSFDYDICLSRETLIDSSYRS